MDVDDIYLDVGVDENRAFLKTYFEMLEACKRMNPSRVSLIISHTEEIIKSGIDGVNSDTLIEYILLQNDEYMIRSLKDSMYPYLKPIYDELILLEARKQELEARKPENRAFLKTYFEMLEACKRMNPSRVSLIISLTEQIIKSGIDGVNSDTLIEYILLQNDEYMIRSLKDSLYTYLKEIYDELILLEARKRASGKQISLAGRDIYNTYNFNSHRCQTPFDTNFNRDDPHSMLLFNTMHGGVILDKKNNYTIKDCGEGAFLNKFSTAGMGQCSFNTNKGNQYIAYLMCYAVSHGQVLDMPVIFREAIAHQNTRTHNTPAEQYLITKPNIERQRDLGLAHQNECTDRNFDELKYGDLLGDESSNGSKYLEKIYGLGDINEANGIYICKDWVEIDAKPMDNLLENNFFLTFILEKYIGKEKEHVYNRITTTKSIIDLVTDVAAINKCMLSDVIKFCEKYGKPHISMVDDSCSVFEPETYLLTQRQIALIADKIRKLGPSIAKGIKRNKTKRNKTKRNKTKRNKTKRNKTKRKK